MTQAKHTAVTRPGLKSPPPSGRPGILVHLFGRDGRGRLTLRGFEAFLQSLHSELRDLEFKCVFFYYMCA